MRSAAALAPASQSFTPRARSDLMLSVEVGSLAEVEQVWRDFERDSLATPYGRFDWVQCYAATLDDSADIRVVVVRDAGGRVVFLFAARRSRRFGLRVATSVGGKHANINLPLMDVRVLDPLDRASLHALVRRIGRAMAVDVVSIPNCPTVWAGAPNPLAANGVPSPSNAYGMTLGRDPDVTLAAASSGHARKKLRSKERGLAKLGEIAFVEAKTADEVSLMLAAYLEQKRQRFQALGIADPYGPEAAQRFLQRAAFAGLDAGEPAIEFYGLTLDGHPIAVLGGAGDRARLSAMFISYEATGEAARFSPGEVLVSHVIAAQCRRGRTAFDLGIGEARYKQTFCAEVIGLADVLIPTTLAGRLYAVLGRRAITVKRSLKQTPWVMRMLAAVRKRRAAAA